MNNDLTRVLSSWDTHTEGGGRCDKFGDNCPLMGTLGTLTKINIGEEVTEQIMNYDDSFDRNDGCFSFFFYCFSCFKKQQ